MALVLVTGASSGIGAATAARFVQEGDTVLLLARSTDRLAAMAGRLGKRAIACPCDAADAVAVDAALGPAMAAHGVPDVVVNCAGAGVWERVEDTSDPMAHAMMDAPYFAAFNVTRAVMPGMRARNSGTLIHVNSPACLVPWPSSVGYAAARGALRSFHEALLQDLAGTALRSCQVIFGHTASAYFANNPGVEDKLPPIDRTLPVLSVEDCARTLARVARRPRTQVIRPRLLAVYAFHAALFPGLTRWMVRLGR